MATLMDVQTVETQTVSRRPFFSAIRWGAIFAGVVSGTASYLLLALLGLAVGLTAVDPGAAEPVGSVPLGTGIWTGISMLVGAFIGGYVAGHASGLARSMDGMLHGFVSWGATTLLYVVLATTALGAVLGGTFRIISQAVQAAAPVAQEAGGGQGVVQQLQGLIGQQGQVQVSAESLKSVQEALTAGDRQRAIDIMVNQMGMERENAAKIVEQVGPLVSGQNLEQAATQATEALTATSWWLFIALLLSLALGIAGGATGVRANANRLAGDHTGERQTVT